MQCPECDFDNPEGSKFCGGCGNALQLNCAQCNSINPPSFRFCGECGRELTIKSINENSNFGTISNADYLTNTENAPEPESERKFVTVLFSDLTGYTDMSDRLNPEEVK